MDLATAALAVAAVDVVVDVVVPSRSGLGRAAAVVELGLEVLRPVAPILVIAVETGGAGIAAAGPCELRLCRLFLSDLPQQLLVPRLALGEASTVELGVVALRPLSQRVLLTEPIVH